MLLAIADFADDDGNAYPAVPTLAAKCRMSGRNANHILAALRASGELEVRLNEGPRGTNRYRIRSGEGLKAASSLKPSSSLKKTSAPESAATLKPTSSTPEAGSPKPLKPTSDEPSLNHQEPSSIARKRAKGAISMADRLFDRFYDAYPRKVARGAAEKAFRKLKPTAELVNMMIAAIGAQGLADRCAAGEAQFVPHPATWLTNKRWADAPAPKARPVMNDDHVFAGAPR